MGMFTNAMKSIKSAPGSVANGTVNAYRRHALANKASFGTGSRLISGAMQDGMKGFKGAWDASSRKGQSGFIGSMSGMVAGAGLGYAASPDGWGGAGAAGGAAAGLFGGARAGNFVSAFARNHSYISGARAGLAGPHPNMMRGMQIGASKAWKYSKANLSMMDKAMKFKSGFMANRAARNAKGA